MAKLKQKSGLREVHISEVQLKDNVRESYKNIPELASSILKYGQQQACGVDKDMNIIWGHRRYMAVKHLNESGNSVLLKVVTAQGDRKALQMIENLHREDLTPEEKEKGVREMIETGMSQKEAARMLCLSEQNISDILAGGKVREKAEKSGADTSGLSTSAMSAARSVEPEKLPEVIKEAKQKGGTVKAVKEAVKAVKSDSTDSFMSDVREIENHWSTNPDLAKDLERGVKIIGGHGLYKESTENNEPKKLIVKCSRNCDYQNNGYCKLLTISIDSFGMCGNYEEIV